MFQAEDPDVTLLKKARQEKKVKRYLEDNFRNREGKRSVTGQAEEVSSSPTAWHSIGSF